MMKITNKRDYLPLVNKYSVKTIDDMILTPELRRIIKEIIKTKHINKTIITGGTGIGKTLLVNLLVKEILEDQNNENGCLNLTTSSSRGLGILKTILPQFCGALNSTLKAKNISKIVLMDEADNITPKAQNLIVNTMEEYPEISFVFTCNDSSKLIEDIQTNCTLITLPNIGMDDIVAFLVNICEKEVVQYTNEALRMIAENCNGDVRATINLLDSVKHGFSVINMKNVNKVLYNPSTIIIKEIIKCCAQKDLFGAIERSNKLKLKGFCNSDILVTLINVLERVKIDERIRLAYIEIVFLTIKKISNDVDTDLQICGCLSQMMFIE